MKKAAHNEMKNFLNALRSTKAATVEPTVSSGDATQDRDLIMRISEALRDVLDSQCLEEGKERAEFYGFTSMGERIRRNSGHPLARRGLEIYNALPLERKMSANRSMQGTYLFLEAETFDDLLSCLVLVGYSNEDADRVLRKDIWSDESATYVRDSVSSTMTWISGIYSYMVEALGEEAGRIFGDECHATAKRLKDSLGKLDSYGEPDCYGFNRGWVHAKTRAEKVVQKTRGRKSRERAEADMRVDLESVVRRSSEIGD